MLELLRAFGLVTGTPLEPFRLAKTAIELGTSEEPVDGVDGAVSLLYGKKPQGR